MSRRFVIAVLFAMACGSGGGGGEGPRDLAGLSGLPDLPELSDLAAAAADLHAAQTACPCALGSYCDLATNLCVVGCIGNDHCPATEVCDTKAFVCRRSCTSAQDCPPHVECVDLGTTGQRTCLGCVAEFGDCNGDPSDGCETALTTDDNCGACGAAPTHSCPVDSDGDNYPDPSGAYHVACTCPTGGKPDCDDGDPDVHPWPNVAHAGSANGGDYNCDGKVEVFYDHGTACDAACTWAVWVGVQPGCGETGTIAACTIDPQLGCIAVPWSTTFAQLCF